MMFYIRDIFCSRLAEAKIEVSNNDAHTYNEIIAKPPTNEEIVQFMVKRHQVETCFNRHDLFFTGKMKLSEQYDKMIDALCKKDGLVPDNKKVAFRKELQAKKSNAGSDVARRKSLVQDVLSESRPQLMQAIDNSKRQPFIDLPELDATESNAQEVVKVQKERILDQQNILEMINNIIDDHQNEEKAILGD